MVYKLNNYYYTDLDTFYFNCKYHNDEGEYSYGCSHPEACGQCLDRECPILSIVDKNKDTEGELNKLEKAGLYINWKDKPEEDEFTEQEDGWGDDIIMICAEKDIYNFDFNKKHIKLIK